MNIKTAYNIIEQLGLSQEQKNELARMLQGKKRKASRMYKLMDGGTAIADFKGRLKS